MSRLKSCPPAPGPLEGFAAKFDDLFTHLAQRRGFRECLVGLLAPRDRNKTLTCLAGTEPVTGSKDAAAHRLAGGKRDPAFHTKWWIAADLAVRAAEDGFCFRAVTGDCGYGDIDDFRAELRAAGLPFVLAVRPNRGTWARQSDAHTPVEAARALAWGGPDQPGHWRPVTRRFRDGHTTTWWAAEARLGGWGPNAATRLVVATADPATLPGKATWYLVTNLPRPGGPHDPDLGGHGGAGPHPAAGLAELVRIYCAFTFCWRSYLAVAPADQPAGPPIQGPERGRRPHAPTDPAHTPTPPRHTGPQLAEHATRRPLLADPRDHATALVEQLVHQAPAP